MKKHLSSALLIASVSIAISACVPARKYEELKQKFELSEADREQYKTKSLTLESSLTELTAEVEDLRTKKSQLEADTTNLGVVNRRLQTQYDKINNLNDELLKKYALLQKGSQDENAKLLAELDQTRLDLQKKEDDLKKLEQELNTKSANLSSLTAELKKREAKVDELQELIAQKEAAVKSLKNKITEALLSFKNQGLTVEQKNGKVYVSLDAKLLFPSGSTEVDKKGKEALIKLASALEETPDVEILVEGHTDTDKIASSIVPRNNWELSVLRATAVVDLMLANSKLDPKRLIASGRGEYLPISTEKAKNRRTEIILSPNLDKLMKIINNEK